MTKIRHGGTSWTTLNGAYLRLDGTNVPTANYSWTTSLTTTGNLQGTTVIGTTSGVFGGTLTIASGAITDTTGTINFDNENLTTTGTITGGTFTDGTLTITGGSITGAVNITATGTIQGGTLTDGVASLTGGAWTGATYNGLTITTGVNTFTLTSGTTDLTVSADCTINQDLSNTSSPTFNALTVTSINGLTGIGCAANVISITCGTTDLTVSADCAINQNLNTAASPSFAGVTVGGTLVLGSGSITDTTGAISFGNENLSTTGNLTIGTNLLFVDSNTTTDVGIGTLSPNTVASWTDAPNTYTILNVYNNTVDEGARVSIQGHLLAGIDFVDLNGGANDKWIVGYVNLGGFYWGSLRDDGTAFVNANILTMDLGTGYVGMGVHPADARLEVQTTATEGRQAVTIDQNDADQAFIDYQGTSSADYANNISTLNGDGSVTGPRDCCSHNGWAFVGMVKVEISGSAYWMPYYRPDTS